MQTCSIHAKSPPLGRGARTAFGMGLLTVRITPAQAGSTQKESRPINIPHFKFYHFT